MIHSDCEYYVPENDYMKTHGGFKQLVINESGNWFKEVQ